MQINTPDKKTEFERYDNRAIDILSSGSQVTHAKYGSDEVGLVLKSPYLSYENILKSLLKKEGMTVLEIASGTGLHTGALFNKTANIIVSDISLNSLKVLRKDRCRDGQELYSVTTDMEVLPFRTASFDIVCSAGSLAYGDPELVRHEISRILRPGGYFVCVDSLNNNPIYRFNRFIHYSFHKRSSNVLTRIPSAKSLESYSDNFEDIQLEYFGSITWLTPLLVLIIGEKKSALFSDWFDQFINIRLSAFKFVMLAKKK